MHHLKMYLLLKMVIFQPVMLVFRKGNPNFFQSLQDFQWVDLSWQYCWWQPEVWRENQLRLVVDPNIHQVLAPSKVVGVGISEPPTVPWRKNRRCFQRKTSTGIQRLASVHAWRGKIDDWTPWIGSKSMLGQFLGDKKPFKTPGSPCCFVVVCPLKLPTLFRQWSDMCTPNRYLRGCIKFFKHELLGFFSRGRIASHSLRAKKTAKDCKWQLLGLQQLTKSPFKKIDDFHVQSPKTCSSSMDLCREILKFQWKFPPWDPKSTVPTVPECSSGKTHALEKLLGLADLVGSHRGTHDRIVSHESQVPHRYRQINAKKI